MPAVSLALFLMFKLTDQGDRISIPDELFMINNQKC